MTSTRSMRRFGLAVLGLAAVLVLVELIPGQGETRGAPAVVIFFGVLYGLINSLTAAGIVLVYRTTRVLNFAQTAIGVGGAVLCFDLIQMTAVPFWLAIILGVALAGALGAAFDLVFGRRFARAPRLVLTVFTIIVAGVLGGAAKTAVDALPIFPPAGVRTVQEAAGTLPLPPIEPFPDLKLTLPGLAAPVGFSALFAVVSVIVGLLLIGTFLRFTRFGVAVRAMAENSERAGLLGISVGMLGTIVWTLAGVLSGLSVTLAGLQSTASVAAGFAPALLLPAFVAAVVAGMRSIPIAVVAAVAISVFAGAIQFLQPSLNLFVSTVLLVVVAGALLAQGRGRGRSETPATSSWAAIEELRPVPREMLRLAPLRAARWVLIAIAVVALLVYPFVFSTGEAFLGQVIAINAIVGLSLVVLTGWGGQVSLGQFGYVAIGAFTAALFSQRYGVSFWLAVPLAAVVTGIAAALTGLPALRIPGLFLGVATFAFAVAMRDLLFDPQLLGQALPNAGIHRPQLLVIDFEDERSMYFLCAAALVLCLVLVVTLRRSRFGRVIIAVRENEAVAASAGIPVLRTKLAAFAFAGILAGFAGALLTFQQRTLGGSTFSPAASINVFVQVVIGGVGSVWGPLLGSAFLNGVSASLRDFPDIAALVAPVAALFLLVAYPGGLTSILAMVRDAILRIVAQRNQMIVPSLFADMDPEALRLRLIPLTAPTGDLASRRRRYRLAGSMLAAPRVAASAPSEEAVALRQASATAEAAPS